MDKTLRHINKGFLKKKELYLDTQKKWVNGVNTILKDSVDDFEEWLETKDAKGKLIMNANPIYSIIKKDKSKALRITQDEPRSNKPYMFSWISVFDKGEHGDNIPMLTISLELSNITQMESLKLIEKWFVNYNDGTFKHLLNASNKKFEKNYVKSDIEKALELHGELDNIKTIGALYAKIEMPAAKISDDLAKSFYRVYSIHNTWKKNYDTPISKINESLASSIYILVSAITGLISDSGNIKYSRTPKKNPYSNIKKEINKHYSTVHLFQMYSELIGKIEPLNQDLYEKIEDEIEKSQQEV